MKYYILFLGILLLGSCVPSAYLYQNSIGYNGNPQVEYVPQAVWRDSYQNGIYYRPGLYQNEMFFRNNVLQPQLFNGMRGSVGVNVPERSFSSRNYFSKQPTYYRYGKKFQRTPKRQMFRITTAPVRYEYRNRY